MPLVAAFTLKFFNTLDSKVVFFLNFSGDNAETYISTYQELAKSHQGKEDRKFLKEQIKVEEMES